MVRFIRLLLNEKGRFLWSAHRITERQKAGKARSIKGKQLKNSRNTVSKQLVALRSSQRDKQIEYYKEQFSPENIKFSGIFIFAISFNMPCISALAATARETHSVKWRAKIGVFYTAAALLVSCIVYHIGLLVFFKKNNA